MEERMCPVHGVPFKRYEKEGKVWYAHKHGDEWCNEDKLPKGVKTEIKPDVKTEQKHSVHENKNISYALSYAKDLCCAGLIPLADICTIAYYFTRFLDGNMQFTETQIIKALKLDAVKPQQVVGKPEQEKSATARQPEPTKSKLAELMQAMNIHGHTPESMKSVCKRLGFPEDSKKLTSDEIDAIIKEIEPKGA